MVSTTLQQRLEIEARAHCGETDAQISEAMHLCRWTVRKWRRRAQRAGRAGLASPLGRPRTGVLGHFSPEVRQVLRELRAAHPGWGPVTLRLETAKASRCAGEPLPSRARVAAFLKAEKLTRRYEPKSVLTQPSPPVLTAPHLEWEMDAQGVRQVTGVGKVSIINIGDPYSHVRVGSQACLGKTKAATWDYQLALRRAFLRYGMPAGISLDHDSAFFDNLSASPYPSLLHLWLIALKISVRFIEVACPTQHGFIERTHPVLDHQAMWGQVFATPATLQPALDQRREFLNREYPSRVWAGQPPLVACPTAQHSGRAYRPENEAALLDLGAVYTYLAQQQWFRQVTHAGQMTLGAHRYGLGKAWGNQTVEIHFDAQTQEFLCLSADGQRTIRLQAKGLTKRDLMGELPLEGFPNYQFAFPWAADVCRLNVLHTEMTGTTL